MEVKIGTLLMVAYLIFVHQRFEFRGFKCVFLFTPPETNLQIRFSKLCSSIHLLVSIMLKIFKVWDVVGDGLDLSVVLSDVEDLVLCRAAIVARALIPVAAFSLHARHEVGGGSGQERRISELKARKNDERYT